MIIMSSASVILLAVTTFVSAYNTPDCGAWPSEQVWLDELGLLLSDNAALHGPFVDRSQYYASECETLGTDAYAISQAGHGMCMHAHACQHEFCRANQAEDLPAYIAQVQTAEDIQAAVAFARRYSIQVVVKTSGHSYHGASTARDSLLIWMQNYPKDGTITTNYTDSCDVDFGAVIGINGGEVWNDVLEAVGPDYHVVTGGGRTVSAAGGWLQGSGLSFTSRTYGLGVDQAVDFEVVLTNGSVVVADACSHPDLFWALRGGGGGTFGIVTHVSYQLHPVVPITVVSWFMDVNALVAQSRWTELRNAVLLWLTYWARVSPTMDNRVSGFWNAVGASLYFVGTLAEAETAFLDAWDEWYHSTLVPQAGFAANVWGALQPSSSFYVAEYDNWYESKGGAAAYNDAAQTDATGDAYTGVEYIAARLMPIETVVADPDGVAQFLTDLVMGEGLGLGTINYFLAGVVQDVNDTDTAVHPALRNAIWNVFTSTDAGADFVRDFIGNDVTGVCFNHHSPVEPDWRNASFGANYQRLEEVKNVYDPQSVLNCWHCVGYQGTELPSVPGEISPTCPPTASPITTSPTTTTTSSSNDESSYAALDLSTALLVVAGMEVMMLVQICFD